MSSKGTRQLLVDMAKQSYTEELFAGTSGNLSVFDGEKGIMSITPSAIPYTTMAEGDIVDMRLDGTIIHGSKPPSSEWRMHASVYQSRADVKAVVHTHSPYATSFSVTHTLIPVILIEMVPFLGGCVPVAKFGLPGTFALGETVLSALEACNACLMANHGVLAIGQTLQQAYTRTVYVEDAARIYALALSHGKPILISDEDVAAMKSKSSGR